MVVINKLGKGRSENKLSQIIANDFKGHGLKTLHMTGFNGDELSIKHYLTYACMEKC